jgi:hypothetical protein
VGTVATIFGEFLRNFFLGGGGGDYKINLKGNYSKNIN